MTTVTIKSCSPSTFLMQARKASGLNTEPTEPWRKARSYWLIKVPSHVGRFAECGRLATLQPTF